MKRSYAKRLSEILKKGQQANKTNPFHIAYSIVFEIEAENFPAIYISLSNFAQLIDKVVVEMDSIPDLSVMRPSILNLKNILLSSGRNFNEQWAVFINQITIEMVSILDYIATQVEKSGLETEIDEEELNRYISYCKALIEQISSSTTLSPTIKTSLIEYVNHLIEGIIQYKVFGLEPFYKAYKDIVFESVEKRDIFKNLEVDPLFGEIEIAVQKYHSFIKTAKGALTTVQITFEAVKAILGQG
jgi:hypothetical protein